MNSTSNNEQLNELIKKCKPNLDWANVETEYQRLKTVIEPYQKQYRADKLDSYWELTKS